VAIEGACVSDASEVLTTARDRARWTITLVRAVLAVARERRVVFMAASLAYFAVISLVPLLLLVVIALSTLREGQLGVDIATYAAGVISPRESGLLAAVVTGAADRERATLLGGVVLLWGTLLLFRALDDAFGQIYEDGQTSLFLGDAANALLVFSVVVGAVVAMIGLSVLLSVVVRQQIWQFFGPFVLLVVLSIVFFPMFYLFPDADLAIREAIPGTVFTAAGWTILQILFSIYTESTGYAEFYGAAGTVLLLLTWLFIGGLIVLIGAVLNAVLAGRVAPNSGGSLGYI
jgi:membrane protein